MSEHLDTKAIEARLAAATPGPWNVRERWYEDSAPDWVVGGLKARGRDGCGMTKEDADFIAHAPADIAALLAEVARLKARLVVTPEKVEAAAEAAYNQFFDVGDWQDSPQNAEHACWRGVGSAALLAAGMTDAAPDAAEEGR